MVENTGMLRCCTDVLDVLWWLLSNSVVHSHRERRMQEVREKSRLWVTVSLYLGNDTSYSYMGRLIVSHFQ